MPAPICPPATASCSAAIRRGGAAGAGAGRRRARGAHARAVVRWSVRTPVTTTPPGAGPVRRRRRPPRERPRASSTRNSRKPSSARSRSRRTASAAAGGAVERCEQRRRQRARRRRRVDCRLAQPPRSGGELGLVGEREERHAGGGRRDERVEAHAEHEPRAFEARGRGGEVGRRLEDDRADPPAQRGGERGVAVGLPRLEGERDAGVAERREHRAQPLAEVAPAGEVAQRDDDCAARRVVRTSVTSCSHGEHQVTLVVSGRERKRPRGVGADAHRRRRAGGREALGRLVVAQHEQVRGVDDRARQAGRHVAAERSRAGADDREQLALRLDRGRQQARRGASSASGARPDDGCSRLKIVPPANTTASAPRTERPTARMSWRAIAAVRGAPRSPPARSKSRRSSAPGSARGERRQQRLVARVALAERSGEQHAGS